MHNRHSHFCEKCADTWQCGCEDYINDTYMLCDEHDPEVTFFADPEFLENLQRKIDENNQGRAL